MTRFLPALALLVGMALTAALGHARDEKTAPKGDKKGPVAVTAGDVTYVVTKSAVGADGLKWTLVLEATSKSDSKLLITSARAVSPEGKTFEAKSPMGKKDVRLPEGTKILIELSMGDLPKDVAALARVELYGERLPGIPGFDVPKTRGFGEKKAEAARPLVLKDVPVTRPEK